MDSHVKKELVQESFLTTDPKLILRKPKPFSERHSALLKLIAGIAGAILALFLIWRFKKMF